MRSGLRMTSIVMGLGAKCQPQNSICFFAGGHLLDCLNGPRDSHRMGTLATRMPPFPPSQRWLQPGSYPTSLGFRRRA
jgi:hypothetical protein